MYDCYDCGEQVHENWSYCPWCGCYLVDEESDSHLEEQYENAQFEGADEWFTG